MKILAIESSTTLGGVSLLVDGEIKQSLNSRRQKSHSDIIHQYIEHIFQNQKMDFSEIDYFAVGIGPGSFTGIRVAVNTVKTFSYVLNKPIIVVDSLESLAYQAFMNSPDLALGKSITVMMNAYKNMVYFGRFEFKNGIPIYLNHPQAIPVKHLSSHIIYENELVVGDGYTTYQTYIEKNISNKLIHLSDLEQYPHPNSVALLAYAKFKNNVTTYDWKSFTPLYLRASEAEENKQGILLIPLS